MLKVILFDIDNTLLSFDGFVKETMKSGFEKFGIGPYQDEMFQTFTQINSGLWQDLERGTLPFEELKRKRWNLIFERLGKRADGEAFEQYFRECLFESAIPMDGAMEILEYLRGSYTLCAASNGPYLQQINRLKLAGMLPYFFDLFISEEIGWSKPSEKFFNTCMERLNLKLKQKIQPCEMMIVGDSLSSDMAGGIQFGMQTCFLNPHRKPISTDLTPDHQIASLDELKNILR